jgi:hypothetical protein
MQYGRQTMPRILLLLLFLTARAGEPVAITRLDWLSGCWSSDGGEQGSGEQWTTPAAGTLFGMSRMVRGGETVAWEFVRIHETDNGSLSLVAVPSGQDSHTFQLAEISEHEVVFADPAHDFPQRIIYRLLEPGRLLGRIEGEVNGRFRGVDFPLTRASCGE